MKQDSFFPKIKKAFGPQDLCNKRKEARTLSSRHAIHLILKSTKIKDYGSFYKYKKLIKEEMQKFSNKFGLKIFSYTIMNDHIHLIIQIQNRNAYTYFVQAFAGSVALKIVKLKKGENLSKATNSDIALNDVSTHNKTLAPNTLKKTKGQQNFKTKGFWFARPYTRILEWGKDLQTTLDYLYQNEMEAIGMARYSERNASTIHQRLRLFTDHIQRDEDLSYEEHMDLVQLSLQAQA